MGRTSFLLFLKRGAELVPGLSLSSQEGFDPTGIAGRAWGPLGSVCSWQGLVDCRPRSWASPRALLHVSPFIGVFVIVPLVSGEPLGTPLVLLG